MRYSRSRYIKETKNQEKNVSKNLLFIIYLLKVCLNIKYFWRKYTLTSRRNLNPLKTFLVQNLSQKYLCEKNLVEQNLLEIFVRKNVLEKIC